ncbi:glycoside hydrolase family 88 protein [Paenibacillus oryzisoli]|uniref:glycoside hydrolase family 88/105 protein n=1 Tax=Paenibacillus oryzisoli TaxID=1850517 RepID=UPI003D266B6B
MTAYFAREESIFFMQGHQPAHAIATIANSYLGSNPAHGFTFRSIHQDSFKQLEDGRYDMNLNAKFPNAALGSYGYAFAGLYSDQEETIELSLSCYGPVRIYLNEGHLYKSTMDDDVNVQRRKTFTASLRKGWNAFFIKLLKTASGFGCQFGSSNGKWFPLHYLSPFVERSGMGGWAYTSPVAEDRFPDDRLPDFNSQQEEIENLHNVIWQPSLQPPIAAEQGTDLQELFNTESGDVAYAWTSFIIDSPVNEACQIHLSSAGKLRLWLDQTLSADLNASSCSTTYTLTRGRHDCLVEIIRQGQSWNFTLDITQGGRPVALQLPAHVHGTSSNWLYVGPFTGAMDNPEHMGTLHRLFTHTSAQGSHLSTAQYWRTGEQHCFVRPYLENERYAKWNYPLGVTLYGLLQTGRELQRPDLIQYVIGHVQSCTNLYDYSLWDQARYGSPAINHQLVELNMLDDCGSFGSAMLEANREADDPTIRRLAHTIGHYILHSQERKEDGAFYRQRPGEYQENTLWADDLYMSTPFLCRYYEMTGDLGCITDAARQFLLFKNYLFIPDHHIMSHVYDFKYETPTYVPWGRGNGWVLFSLSELLAVLPENHELRSELIDFFRTLAAGYLKLQGANGLWHQVLTDSASYEEASCTAMFTYAFCRGIRYGWLDQPVPYAEAAHRAWEGLTKLAIDKSGNVYGVCRGSGYSFTPLYYKEELNWILNDTHGIGIVLLCGIEYMKLQAL